MIRCPHCRQAGVPILRKAILSPGLLATCSLCKGESSLRYTGWLTAMIPGSALMIVSMFVDNTAVEWTLSGIGMVLVIALPLWFAPLHKEPGSAAAGLDDTR